MVTDPESDPRIDPIAHGKWRLLELEGAIERRYLKPPLGQANAGVSLQKLTEHQEKEEAVANGEEGDNNTAMEVDNNGREDNMDTASPGEEAGEDDVPESGASSKEASSQEEEGITRGLHNWREGVKQAGNAAQLAMCFYILETSIAWHKSIMKASCQFCHGGDNENALLLCDSCDKGYHTYCFKPAITIIPEGDW